MNHATLDRESFDCVSWYITTPAKLNKANAMLSKKKHYIDQKTLKAIDDHAIFKSHLCYSSLVWAQNFNSTKRPFILRKKSIKAYAFFRKRCTYILILSLRILISLSSMIRLHLRTLSNSINLSNKNFQTV